MSYALRYNNIVVFPIFVSNRKLKGENERLNIVNFLESKLENYSNFTLKTLKVFFFGNSMCIQIKCKNIIKRNLIVSFIKQRITLKLGLPAFIIYLSLPT